MLTLDILSNYVRNRNRNPLRFFHTCVLFSSKGQGMPRHLDKIQIQGCILNVKFIFLPPPPILIHIFPQRIFITMRSCAPQVKNFKPFL